MIFFFLRRRLLLDTDAGELARVKLVLDQNGIEYHVKTTVSENAPARTFGAAAASRYVATYSAASAQSYLYQLFVKRKDYAKARKLAYGR